ncbi:MAG: [FeFe] hydrogenase H-cluster radical SAM maturase HydG [Rikenellaceae bacterium]|jgi:2-iminoacetate synthase|nr:[FeFe] hydrogenase H-cluster radical SAM maturase HydG [Rikenellaceae bacterium]
MIFHPQSYTLADRPGEPFIDPAEIEQMLAETASPSLEQVRQVIARSLGRERLSLRDTAVLLNAEEPAARALILESARQLKQQIYGNRIVLFAPLYIGNRCINHCAYCGFRAGNRAAIRHTLSDGEIARETRALEASGHKRLILVYGEHPAYSPEYIAHTVQLVYGTKNGSGEIRRVNINAAPLSVEGFRTVRRAGIGTYQIFQETYHPEAYARFHPAGPKRDYLYRLTAFDRAMEAGIDDVGIGALLGLYDWRFEVMALVRHTNHLEACFGVGPHTISFPRVKNASEVDSRPEHLVSDDDFIRLVAILRLAVPYTGLILTAREPAALRDRLIEYGVSQIDGGTKLEIGGYSSDAPEQNLHREQFQLNDERPLSEVIRSLIERGRIPSFCTACYRKGRTGEHFMEFSVNGFIKRFCTPNALLTFAEYLENYADPATRQKGWQLIEAEVEKQTEATINTALRDRLTRIQSGEKDNLF